jgi:hypothetical protein
VKTVTIVIEPVHGGGYSWRMNETEEDGVVFLRAKGVAYTAARAVKQVDCALEELSVYQRSRDEEVVQ